MYLVTVVKINADSGYFLGFIMLSLLSSWPSSLRLLVIESSTSGLVLKIF